MSVDCECSPFLDQVYEDIKRKLLGNGQLFEDDQFPPNDASLVRNKSPGDVQWKRAKELSEDAKFIIHNGTDNGNDIAQGGLGDCWFLAAASAIARIPDVFMNVVPHDQTFDDDEYCGIFHFRFWRYGEWVDVVVDDYLPVDPKGDLIYCSSRESKNEYWCALLEKAYAKLHDCYEFLDGGDTTDAMIDMTGGIKETFYLPTVSNKNKGKKTENDPNALWRFLKRVMTMQSICSCGIDSDIDQSELNGLYAHHAYSVTKVEEISEYDSSYSNFESATSSSYDTKNARMVRVRNPHGEGEWQGKFSDGSEEWDNISDEDKQRMGRVFENDGEFWMTYEDFLTYFETLEIVHLNLNACFKQMIREKNKERDWNFEQFVDSWESGNNSGGADSENESFWTNPQYTVTVTGDKASTLIVGLMQIGSRENRAETNGEGAEKNLGFYLYKVKNDAIQDTENDGKPVYSDEDLKLMGVTELSEVREIMKRFRLNEGTYVIIPCLENKDDEADFLLRYYLDSYEETE